METLKKTMEKLKKTMEKLKRHEPQKKFQNCKKIPKTILHPFTFQDAGLGREGRLMHGSPDAWVRNASDVDAGTCVPKFQFQCYGTNM